MKSGCTQLTESLFEQKATGGDRMISSQLPKLTIFDFDSDMTTVKKNYPINPNDV